jgi:type II secretory pathway component PulC
MDERSDGVCEAHGWRVSGDFYGVLYLERCATCLAMHATAMNRLTHWILHEAWIVMLELALVAALAVSLAYWTWVAIAPASVGVPSSAAAPATDRAEQVAHRNLFGVVSSAPAAAPRAASAGLTVLGIFSGRRSGEGRAIIARQGSRPVTVATGESIADGLSLQEVHPDHVIVLRNGVPERLDLERRVTRAASIGPAAPTQVRP